MFLFISARMIDLTAFQRDILWYIAELGDPKGLAIKEEMEEYHETEIHHGRLYPNLDELVDRGLVMKGTKDRRTNEYTLSPRGQRDLEDRLDWLGGRVSGAPEADVGMSGAAEVRGD